MIRRALALMVVATLPWACSAEKASPVGAAVPLRDQGPTATGAPVNVITRLVIEGQSATLKPTAKAHFSQPYPGVYIATYEIGDKSRHGDHSLTVGITASRPITSPILAKADLTALWVRVTHRQDTDRQVMQRLYEDAALQALDLTLTPHDGQLDLRGLLPAVAGEAPFRATEILLQGLSTS